MMHRESGSYFHFLLRGWLISYYIVHQRPVISPDSTCKCNGWFRVGLF